MPRGKPSKDGDTNVAKNGYHYTKVDGHFRLTHHIIAEQALGRSIEPDETVSFADNDRTNLDPTNIVVSRRKTSLNGKIAALTARILELTAERDRLVAIREKQGKAKTA